MAFELVVKNTLLKNIGLLVVAILLSGVVASWLGSFYNSFFKAGFGGDIIGDTSFWELVAGFPLALIFFLTLLFTLFAEQKYLKKYLLWSLALPALFELVFDFSHIYFPIALGLIAYGIGWVLRNFLARAV